VGILSALENMKEDNACSGCGQKETCRGAYERIGSASGPNVAWKVIVAFVLPIGVFVLTLAGATKLLTGHFGDKLLTLLSFLLALVVTILFVCVIRVIRGPLNKDICDKGKINDGNSQ
jgi:hypothetical protein